MRMGRIGDGDVHAAYVEFRAKESDKVRSIVSFVLLPSILSYYYQYYYPYQTHHFIIPCYQIPQTENNNHHNYNHNRYHYK